MFRTKGMAGFTLYPQKAFIEIRGKLYNRTPFPQTFLWWANPAVKVNDHYQSIFPPDLYAVFDHGKRDVSSFPVAKGVYYKVDYSPGTDISRYKNIPVPTSYMAINSKYNFIGGYEHDNKGGLLHVANHHISPGKKQWTWGYGEFGQAWDRNLTDEDGPYIELMTGVYTDNQPDFSWLQPFEEKTFVQHFMPYSEVGLVKNATKEAVLGVEINGLQVEVKLYVTSPYDRLKVALLNQQGDLASETISVSPGKPYIKTIKLPSQIAAEEVTATVTDLETGKVLVSFTQETIRQEMPSPARAAKRPKDVENNEQLYLTGLHLEQYRHATYEATDYYEEALRRDDKDVRSNNALGLWYLRRGKFEQAEPYFRKAIATLTQRNPNPYEGEPFYNLGWTLKMQGRSEEAFDAFYKAVWNDAWQHAGYLQLARIAATKQDFEEAFEFIDKSLIKNYHSHTARHLKVVLLRKLGRTEEAKLFIKESLAIDPFNFGCLFEEVLLSTDVASSKTGSPAIDRLKKLSRNSSHNFVEYAFDYAHAGLYNEAVQLLQIHMNGSDNPYPMVYYYVGWFLDQQEKKEESIEYFRQASILPPDFCFPNRIEDVTVLQSAILLNPCDAKALYYLGNFWYDKRQYSNAIACWEKSVEIEGTFPTVHRNLSLAYYNKLSQPAKALDALEKAFDLDDRDARVLMELDQLHKRLNRSLLERLSFLEKHLSLVNEREDLYLERITLYNQLQHYNKAKELITSRQFHPWEGGEGKVVGQYLICHLELAKRAIEHGEYQNALEFLTEAETYPVNLGEGKLYGTQENDIFFLKGLAHAKMGNTELSNTYFTKATIGIDEPVQAIFYNDPQPDKIFYQGLGWKHLGDKQKAISIFKKLISFGTKHLNDSISIDYFAVSLPDLLVFESDLDVRNNIHCLYLMGLGNLGLGYENFNKAEQFFEKVLSIDINHQGAVIHKRMIQFLTIAEAEKQDFILK